MRILHVISSVNPTAGGPIEGIKQLAKACAGDYTAEVASLDTPGAAHVEAFPLRVHALGPSKGKYGYSAKIVPWLKQHAGDYDVVVVNGIWQYHSFAAWRALRGSETPYVVFTHGMLDPWFKRRYPLKHLKKWLYWPWADYRVLRDAKAVMFTCEEERILARQSFWLYRDNPHVVGYGTTGPTVDLAQARSRFLARFPQLTDKKFLTFMGRLNPKKGCDLLIEAFARSMADEHDFHLVFVGPDRDGWQSELVSLAERLRIAHRVHWTGMLEKDDKWGALAASDAFVLPSHQENFGIVVAEALACGVPVLISDKVNIWREIQQSNAGLVANDDVSGTANLLLRWRSMSVEARTQMRTDAVRCFQRYFDLGTTSQAWVEKLRSVRRPLERSVAAD